MGRGFLFILLLVVLPATAQIYKYTDANGATAYSNQPPDGISAQPVDLPPLNSVERQPSGEARPMFRYDMLRVLVPEPDATIRSSAGELIVSITSEPGLQPGHRYRLLLDGQPTAEPGPSPVFALSNIDRGSHQLSIEILDEQGRTVERTANQPFHMQRISLAQKRKTQPCTLTDYGQRPECPLKDKPPEEKNPFLRFF